MTDTKNVSVRLTKTEIRNLDIRVTQDGYKSRSDLLRHLIHSYMDGKIVTVTPPLRKVHPA